MEKVIHGQTSAFLNSRNLLYSYQSGFRKNHSTDYCLSFLNDKILKGFNQGLMTGIILIDLQKAFDTIDHDILLQKLYAICFSKHSVNWFRSYLMFCKDLFLALYSFSYIIICRKLSNVIFFFTLMIYALSVNIMILMKLQNN